MVSLAIMFMYVVTRNELSYIHTMAMGNETLKLCSDIIHFLNTNFQQISMSHALC